MTTVANSTSKINVVFYGGLPLFLNIAMDLERAGCRTSHFPTIYQQSPKFAAFDAAIVKTGDKIPLYEVTKPNPAHSALPKAPEKVTDSSGAIQYAKWCLQANGYLVIDPS